MNNLKTKVGYADLGELKTVPADLKKINDVVNNEASKNKKVRTLKTKII